MFLDLTVQSGPMTDYQIRERKPYSADKPQGVNGQLMSAKLQHWDTWDSIDPELRILAYRIVHQLQEWKQHEMAAKVVIRSDEDLACGIGDYLPPIANLGLKIAAPQGWIWLKRHADYVTRFVEKGKGANNKPRILVEVHDNPFADLRRVDGDNVDEFVDRIKPRLPSALPESVRPAVLGRTGFVRYSGLGKDGNATVEREFLETAAGRQRYVICLEVHRGKLYDGVRDALHAVGMSMIFESQNESPVAGEAQPALGQTSPLD
jgi:hypothetical protein